MKKSLMFISFLCLFNACYADKVTSYKDALKALKEGKLLTYVIYIDHCTVAAGNKEAASVPKYFVYRPDGFTINDSMIRSRGTVFTTSSSSIPITNVLQAFTYDFDISNQLTINNSFLDPLTYTDKIPPLQATCQLGKGFDVFA